MSGATRMPPPKSLRENKRAMRYAAFHSLRCVTRSFRLISHSFLQLTIGEPRSSTGCFFPHHVPMANNKDDHDDSSVVTDKSSRIVADGEHLTPAPPIFSASSAKAHSIERSQINPHPSSQRRSDGGFNDTLNPLRALPELRPIPWHSGKELSPDKSTQSTRVQTRGACLLASRGNVNDPPCNHCKSGVGRFYVCVSLKNWFHGACATCQLATRGNLCSLRTDRDPSIITCLPLKVLLLSSYRCHIRERATRVSICRRNQSQHNFRTIFECPSYPAATQVKCRSDAKRIQIPCPGSGHASDYGWPGRLSVKSR